MYSIQEYANLVGMSRQGVLKQINAGKIKAKKVGRAYIILQEPPEKKEGEPNN